MNKKKIVMLLKNWKLIVISITTVSMLFFCLLKWTEKNHKKPGREPASVNVMKVFTTKDVKTLTAIGIVKAAQGIDVSVSTSSIIQSVDFVSGQCVESGSTIITLKNDELKATVEEDKIKYQLAELNSSRSKKLINKGYVSRQDADLNDSNVQQAKARLDHDEALLEKTIIKAPFSGCLGISQINLGQYISAGQAIVSLQDTSKMFVEFSIPEKHSGLVTVNAKIIAHSNQVSNYEWQGKNIALGSQLDEITRSLLVRAELFPPYKNLKPGMFVNVTVLLPKAKDKPAIPQQSIVYNPYGNFVYLYKKGVVKQRYIDIGQTIGKNVIIEKGLHAGEVVVIEGQQKLHNSAKVQVRG